LAVQSLAGCLSAPAINQGSGHLLKAIYFVIEWICPSGWLKIMQAKRNKKLSPCSLVWVAFAVLGF